MPRTWLPVRGGEAVPLWRPADLELCLMNCFAIVFFALFLKIFETTFAVFSAIKVPTARGM